MADHGREGSAWGKRVGGDLLGGLDRSGRRAGTGADIFLFYFVPEGITASERPEVTP